MAGKLAEALVRAGVLAADAYDIEEELGLRKDNSVNLTATISDGGILFSAGELSLQLIQAIRVPIQRSVYASLVAGATYGQSGNTVTVAATAHGVPAACNGMRFYWPGAAAVPAGWYNKLQVTSADALTFENATSQTVAAGAALTASLPFSTAVALPETVIFKKGDLFPGAQITVEPVRWGDSTAAAKWFRATIGGQIASAANLVSLAGGIKQALTILVRSLNSQLGFSGADSVGGSVRYEMTVNLSNQSELGFVVYFGSAVASQYQVIESIYVTLK